MKMKHLVLGALCLALCASTAWAKPKILDGSLVGWWRFDNPSNYKEDSSGYGSSIGTEIPSSGIVTKSEDGGYQGGKITLEKGKSITATLSSVAPTIPGTSMPYYTLTTRFKSGGTIVSGSGEPYSVINDTQNWHFGAVRYQNDKNSGGPNTGAQLPYATILDPRYRDSDNNWITPSGDIADGDHRPLEMTSDNAAFFVSYGDRTVQIGGSLTFKTWIFSNTYAYYGGIDEVMVFSRMLSKRELTRLRYTGETFVYCCSGNPNFASASGWSCVEGSYSYAPGGAFGVAYLVDDNKTMTQGGSATFGANVANQVSLTLGRKAPLTFVDGNTEVTKQAAGNFNHGSAGTLTFYDLRLVNGKFTGVAGGALNTTLLDIDTPSGSAFEINVPSGAYTITSANAVTGDGTLKKTGEGTLDLTGLTGAAKVVVTEGKVLAGPNITVVYAEDEGAVPVLMVE